MTSKNQTTSEPALLRSEVDKLLALEAPEDSPLARAGPKQLVTEVERFRHLFLELVEHGRDIPPRDSASPVEIFTELLLRVGSTLDFAFYRLATKDNGAKGRPLTCFTFPDLERLAKREGELRVEIEASPGEPSQFDLALLGSAEILYDYGFYLLAAEILCMPASWVLSPSLVASFDSALQSAIHRLAQRLGHFPIEVESLLRRMLRSATGLSAHLARERRDVTNSGHRPGAFSLLRPEELGPIAARDDTMAKRYGSKQLELVFEQQIALTFQSFGFLVIPTVPGKRSVDLLCVSNDSLTPHSIVVEAKSTKGFYSLPARDERALKEYVTTFRRTMRTLPELKALLIVAPRPASTIEAKLKNLSTVVQLPVRFIDAQLLADLREAVPGAVPSDILLSALLAQPELVSSGLVEDVESRMKSIQDAHRQLAEELHKAWGS